MSLAAARGVARVALFHEDGLALFDASPKGLLNALAPWLAFSLVAAALMAARLDAAVGLGDLLGSVIVLVAPPVLSHALARFWGREAGWLRYAVAFAWTQWVMPPALVLALTASFFLMSSGLPDPLAQTVALVGLLVYALALNVFVAERALRLSRWRAVAMVVAVNVGAAVAVLAPRALAMLLDGGAG